MIIFVNQTIMLRWRKFEALFHKIIWVLKIGHFFCPFLIFGITFGSLFFADFFKFTFG